MPCVVSGRSRDCTKILERHPSPFIADALTRCAEDQKRFEVGQPAERQPGHAGHGRSKQQHEARFNGDFHGPPGCRRGAEEHVGEVEILVHPDQKGDKDEPECFQQKRLVDGTALRGMSEAVLRIGRQVAFLPCYNQQSVHVPACAGVAQLVERLIRNQQVRGSSPRAGSSLHRK